MMLEKYREDLHKKTKQKILSYLPKNFYSRPHTRESEKQQIIAVISALLDDEKNERIVYDRELGISVEHRINDPKTASHIDICFKLGGE